MNIETTIVEKVSVTPDDSVYLEVEGLTREQLKGSDLRNLPRREVVANLFCCSCDQPIGPRKARNTEPSSDLISPAPHQLAPDVSESKLLTKQFSTLTTSNPNLR